MTSYTKNREWSDRFLPHVCRIIGPHLLKITPDEIDQKQAADLMVLTARDLRIAVRVRRPGFAERYPFEFTIRAKLDSGAKTELSKIVDGWGDWMLYGHADEAQDLLCAWWLIDLHSFRAALIRQATNGIKIKSGNMPNGDGTHFKWFDIRSFPSDPPLVISSQVFQRQEAAE
jgi:hypothetical protein